MIKNFTGKPIDFGCLRVTVEQPIYTSSKSSVFLCSDIRSKNYALKVYKYSSEKKLNKLMNEANIHEISSKDNFIISLFAKKVDSNLKTLFLLLEIAEKSLKEFMVEEKKLTNDQIINIFQDVCSGVRSLHKAEQPIIHRNLTPENILFCRGTWKISDFGKATMNTGEGKSIKDIKKEIRKSVKRSIRAPELYDLKNGYDQKIDVWQLGCLLFKMCTYKNPFKNKTDDEIINSNFEYPNEIDPSFKKLIDYCLIPDPSKRPSVYEVLLKMGELFPQKIDSRWRSNTIKNGKNDTQMDNAYSLHRSKTFKDGLSCDSNIYVDGRDSLSPRVRKRTIKKVQRMAISQSDFKEMLAKSTEFHDYFKNGNFSLDSN